MKLSSLWFASVVLTALVSMSAGQVRPGVKPPSTGIQQGKAGIPSVPVEPHSVPKLMQLLSRLLDAPLQERPEWGINRPISNHVPGVGGGQDPELATMKSFYGRQLLATYRYAIPVHQKSAITSNGQSSSVGAAHLSASTAIVNIGVDGSNVVRLIHVVIQPGSSEENRFQVDHMVKGVTGLGNHQSNVQLTPTYKGVIWQSLGTSPLSVTSGPKYAFFSTFGIPSSVGTKKTLFAIAYGYPFSTPAGGAGAYYDAGRASSNYVCEIVFGGDVNLSRLRQYLQTVQSLQ